MVATFSVTNGKYIVSGSEDQSIYPWDLQSQNTLQKLEGHTGTALPIFCHPVEKKIATRSLYKDMIVKIWVQE